jgi:hypothetical protein
MKLQLTFIEPLEDGLIVSFKTTQAMNKKLETLAELNGASKSAIIRRFIDYSFKVLDIQNSKK